MVYLVKKVFKYIYNNWLSDKQQVALFKSTGQQMFAHINYLKQLGYNPDIIIDIGAYKGRWTSFVKKIFPSATFLMIEPQKNKEAALKEVAGRFNNVYYQMILTGKENNDSISFYEMETGSSIYKEQTNAAGELKHYQMKKLDRVMEEYKFAGNYFLKLDVQGAEIDVLEGATATLQKTDFILLEASLLNYNQGAPLVADLIAWLDKNDFVLFDICDQQRRNNNTTLVQADLLFSKRNSAIRKKVNFE